ncbi:MAG: phosphatidate cytidylyltransferase [Oscillospiraceae bacterium]|nr:phosphatidate cytidylyltransferase [Oscillospiraceae bacterium]
MAVRIISALVGIVIVFVVLFLHNTIALPIAVAVISSIMIFELFRASKCEKFYPALISACIYNIIKTLSFGTSFEKYVLPLELLAVFAVFLTFIMKHKIITFQQTAFMLASMILVTESMLTIVKTEALDDTHGVVFLVLGLCGAWIADSGAYFAGTFLGKHKLCPEISPKKTVEGFIGGIVTTAIVFVAFNAVYINFFSKEELNVNYILLAVAGAVCAVIGTVGDLSASMIKRQCGIKDYGNIMPGHGGMMDRFDSVIFVMPTFYAFLSVMDIYK